MAAALNPGSSRHATSHYYEEAGARRAATAFPGGALPRAVSDEYDAVVFDLDGTLVDLVVDWDAVATDVSAVLRDHDIDPPERLWDMLDAAEGTAAAEPVEATIAEHEREGARRSERLPAADTIPDGPVAVCSLNCSDACLLALEEHDVEVDAVVGRDSVLTRKPDPEPLLEAVRRLDVEPGRALFVGDGERDERTAADAGTDFVYVSDWLARA